MTTEFEEQRQVAETALRKMNPEWYPRILEILVKEYPETFLDVLWNAVDYQTKHNQAKHDLAERQDNGEKGS